MGQAPCALISTWIAIWGCFILVHPEAREVRCSSNTKGPKSLLQEPKPCPCHSGATELQEQLRVSRQPGGRAAQGHTAWGHTASVGSAGSGPFSGHFVLLSLMALLLLESQWALRASSAIQQELQHWKGHGPALHNFSSLTWVSHPKWDPVVQSIAAERSVKDGGTGQLHDLSDVDTTQQQTCSSAHSIMVLQLKIILSHCSALDLNWAVGG